MNTPDLVGELGYVPIDYPSLFIPDRLWQAYFNKRASIDAQWLTFVLITPTYRQKIKGEATGTSDSMKNISKNAFLSILIPFPTLAEQRAIATALSDVDALLASLDSLIAKKKAIKQGTMQQLLTGKKRLPGFSGEWKTKTLGEILKVKHGKSQKEIEDVNGSYPILATGGEIGRSNNYLCNQPSVLIGRKGTIDKPKYMDTPFWTVDTLFYTEIIKKNNALYIFYLFQQIDWYSYNEASGVPSLNASTIERIEKEIAPIDEQLAIAQILSDMDAEVETLTQKRAKYQAVKQGMMQQLLTGRIRLV